MAVQLKISTAANVPLAPAGGVVTGGVTTVGAFSINQSAKGGIRIVPGGLPNNATAPSIVDDPAATSGWLLATAGAGAAALNQIDAGLGYSGWRLRCAPAAQNLATLSGSTVNAGVYSLSPMFVVTKGRGHVRLRVSVDIRRVVVTGDAFECHVGIVSNFPSAGGFLGFYFSDVEAGGTGNWQAAFLSGAAAYNFPANVPQRLVDTGITALSNPVNLEIVAAADGAGTKVCNFNVDGVTVAQFDFVATPPTANEIAVMQGTGAIPRHSKLVCQKAAGNDTLDLWVGALDGCLDYFGDVIS